MKRHPRLWRVLGWTVGSLVGVPLLLVVLVLTALAVPFTRRPIIAFALDKTNESLDGMRITLEEAARLDLWGIDLRGARVYDDKGREMVYVQRAAVRIKPFGLLRSTLHLTDVGVRGARVHLYPSDEPAEEEPEEPPSEPSSFQIVADQLRVSDASLDMPLADKQLHAVIQFLSAAGGYGPRTWAALQQADIHADVNQQRALTLRTTRGTWDEKQGGEAVLQGDLLDGRFLASARVPALDKMTPWPIERARLDIDGVSNAGLARVGYAEQAQLRVPVSLHIEAHKQGTDLLGALQLDMGKERLSVNARATPQKYSADLRLTPSQLAAVSGLMPPMQLGFDLHVEARHDQQPMGIQLEWRDVEMDGRAVPQGVLNVELALPLIKLTRLTFADFEQSLRLRGQYNLDTSAAQVTLDASEFELSSLGGLLPSGMGGTLNGGLEARLTKRALSGRSELSMRYFRMADTSIDNVTLGLDLSGTLEEPIGDVRVAARQLNLAGTPLLRVDVNAHAGLRELSADLAVEGRERYVALELTGTRSASGVIQLDANGKGKVADKEVGLTIRELRIDSGAYSVRELLAFSGDERLSVSGSFDQRQRIDAALSIVHLDLAPLAKLGLKNDLAGRLDLSARLSGTVEQPYVSGQLAVYGLHSERTPRAPKADLRSALLLDSKAHRAELTLQLSSADRRVAINLDAKAKLAKRARGLAEAFERGSLNLGLTAHTDVPFLEQFAPEGLPAMDGTLDASLRAEGSLDSAKLDFDFLGQFAPRSDTPAAPRDMPAAPRDTPAAPRDQLAISVKLDPQALVASVRARDRAGKLLDLDTRVELPQGGPRALMNDSKKLMRAPVDLTLLLKERRLDQLGGTFGALAKQYNAALPVRVAADVRAASDGKALSGKVAVRAHAFGQGIDPNCDDAAQADIALDAALQDDAVKVTLKAAPSGGGRAEVNADTVLSANALLDGSPFTWGPLTVRAQAKDLALHTMPALCMLPPARTQLTLQADNVGKGPAEAQLSLAMDDIQAGSEGTVGIALKASTSPSEVTAQGVFKLNGAQRGELSAQVPLLYADSQVPAVATDKPIKARVRLPKFPLAALTSFTGAVGRAGGEVEINMGVEGTLSTLEPTGYIQLYDAALSLAALAQPFSNINGRIELERDKLTIRDLKARDRDGKLGITGYAKYARERGGEVEMHMSAERFPLRQQGSIIGELSTRAKLKGKLTNDDKLSLALGIQEGRIWLTGQGGRDVQDLDEHPDVRFDTEQSLLELSDEEVAKAEQADGITLAVFRIETEKALWVQHEDFAVQVGVDLELSTGEEGVTLEGEAQLVRGDLTLLGKPFRIERGAIRFTGDVPPDPELDLRAKHRTQQGQTLNVQVVGRASQPQIIFSGAASNAGEAAVLLSGVGAPKQNAQGGAARDAANFAASLTAGLLAVSARRKFGNWVPMLAIENGASGSPSGARAGFDASALIPKFMRGFAKGMYVEGIVGTRNDTQSRGTGVGVRVEVALPQDFVTSMGYGPGTVWSTDVYWSP